MITLMAHGRGLIFWRLWVRVWIGSRPDAHLLRDIDDLSCLGRQFDGPSYLLVRRHGFEMEWPPHTLASNPAEFGVLP